MLGAIPQRSADSRIVSPSASRFDGEFPAYLWGPVSWPRAVLAAIVIPALAQLTLCMMFAPRSDLSAKGSGIGGNGEARANGRDPRREGGGNRDGGAELEDEWGEAQPGPDARLRILATFTLPFLYLLLLPRTGYFVTTPCRLAERQPTLLVV